MSRNRECKESAKQNLVGIVKKIGSYQKIVKKCQERGPEN